MATAGYGDLASMDGGFHGAFGPGGQLVHPGWSNLGYDGATEAPPERCWSGLAGEGGD